MTDVLVRECQRRWSRPSKRRRRGSGSRAASTSGRVRKPRGARAVDLLIAATALGNDLPLFIRNPDDFDHLQVVGLELRTASACGAALA